MRNLRSQHCGRYARPSSRRDFLARSGAGMGLLALADLLQADARAEDSAMDSCPGYAAPLSPRQPHFDPRVKSIIWLFMEGGPSGVDLFDPKPELKKRDGQRIEIDVFNGDPGPLMKSPFDFKQHGECGAWVCDKYSHIAKHVDDIAFVKSCFTESNDHVSALYQMNSGVPRVGLPTAGSWVTYGLGSENSNLPGFVVLGGSQGIKGGPVHWSSGFLPSSFQGTLFRSQGSPILNLDRPQDVEKCDQRAVLDLVANLNTKHLANHAGEPDLTARIESFELAYRMQTEATDVTDFSNETAETQQFYGLDRESTRTFGRKCLLARRLVERGVRFVQVYSDGESWDAHSNLSANHIGHCEATDIPIHALLTDLKRSGLFDSTLVIWGGEFGRMPVSQRGNGRDHNP
ncbi:MAG: DUF1501 domain-containing protein, partial [Planctomycetales bacterium]|nr:DUF1501 domain-containing protein [Planctomycetales bacterium]